MENNGIKQWLSLIDERVSAVFKSISSNFIRHKFAVVTAYDAENYIAYVIFEDDESKAIHKYYNKSGEELAENDTVRIYYTINIDKGWIGARCGEPKPLSGGMDIDTAVIITPDQSKYMLEEYEIVHEMQGDIYCYGSPKNHIIVSGIVFYNPDVEIDSKTRVRYMACELLCSATSATPQWKDFRLAIKSIVWDNSLMMFSNSYYFLENGGVDGKRGFVSYNTVTKGFSFTWKEIHPLYPTDESDTNYGYVEFFLCKHLRDKECVEKDIMNDTAIGLNTSRVYFVSAAERDAALVVLNKNNTD